MIAEMRIERLALDQFEFEHCSRSSPDFALAEETTTFVLNPRGTPRELLRSDSTAMQYGSFLPVSPPSRTSTLPQITTGGAGGLIARSPRNSKTKQRSNSFVMSDAKFLSRSDPVRRTWDGSYSPRRQSNKDASSSKKNSHKGVFIRAGTLRESFNSDNMGEKNKNRGVSSHKQHINKSHALKARKMNNADESGWVHPSESEAKEKTQRGYEVKDFSTSSNEIDNGSDTPLSVDESINAILKRKIELSSNDINVSEEFNMRNLITVTREMSFNESSDDDQDLATPRLPKSILKKKELSDQDLGTRRNQGVSFIDCKISCRSPARQRSFSMPICSPRPEITFTCSREFAAALEDLNATCDNVFHKT